MFVSKKKLEAAVADARQQQERFVTDAADRVDLLLDRNAELGRALQGLLAVTARVKVDGKIADRRAVKADLDEAEAVAAAALKKLL